MHRSVLMFLVMGMPGWAQPVLSEREYSARCAAYYARQYHLDPALVRAVIQVESVWNPGAVPPADAIILAGYPSSCAPPIKPKLAASHSSRRRTSNRT
jgi:Transglycosylase SLT domain